MICGHPMTFQPKHNPVDVQFKKKINDKIIKMKKMNLKKYILSFLLMFAVTMVLASDPPDPGGDPGTAPPLGGGAPIGGGTLLLLGLGAAYGTKKVYNLFKENLEE